MKKTLWVIVLVLLVVFIDQLTKGFIMQMSPVGFHWAGAACDLYGQFCNGGVIVHGADLLSLPMTSWFKFVFVWNPGTSFSLFRALGHSAPMVIVVLTGIIIGFLGHQLFMRAKERYERVALSLIIGGALGNLIDRIRFNAVIDFLDFHWKAWHWPAFNVADIAICIGVALYLLGWFINKKGKK
ncbi:MAG: signal peptidase II [Alphaproteobacteria bacterium]|nr:signal peptidase II [Alphaproteobacteria bacterium]